MNTQREEIEAEIQDIDEQRKCLVERRFAWLVDWSASLPLSKVVAENVAEIEAEIHNLDEQRKRLVAKADQ